MTALVDPLADGSTILRVRRDRPDLDVLAGDALIVHGQELADPGQVVVCVDDAGETSLRRFEAGQSERVIGLVKWITRRIP